MRFWFDALADQMSWRVENIKAIDPERSVLSHSGAVPPFLSRANACIHNWKFAAQVDGWGTSFAPTAFNWCLGDMNGVLDATRSAARGKFWWVAEMQGGYGYDRGFRKRRPAPSAKNIRVWNWLAAACGAKGISYWCYLTESTGPEAGGFGLVKLNGETTPRALEAARQNKLLNKYHQLLRDYEPDTQVAVLYDPDQSTQLWAMENTDELIGESYAGYARLIFQNDLSARYVTFDTFADLTEKVLIVPMCLSLRADIGAKIVRFVEQGGILISDARMGLFDERGFMQPVLPSFGIDKAAGLAEDESFCCDQTNAPPANRPGMDRWPDDRYNQPVLDFSWPIQAKVQSAEFFSPLVVTGADVIGTYDGIPAAAHHKYGQGEVYYFGTYMGLSIRRGDPGALQVLSAILKRHATPGISGGNLRPRIIEGNGCALLCVFNDDPFAAASDRIAVPGQYSTAVNIFTDESMEIMDGCLALAVESGDVAVIELK